MRKPLLLLAFVSVASGHDLRRERDFRNNSIYRTIERRDVEWDIFRNSADHGPQRHNGDNHHVQHQPGDPHRHDLHSEQLGDGRLRAPDCRSMDCANTISGACDLLFFSNSGETNWLELTTPLGFNGGPVDPFSLIRGGFNSFAGVGANAPGVDSIVASGNIAPVSSVPEPDTGLLALGAIGLLPLRKKLVAQRS